MSSNITPQYQSYGGTSARSEESPVAALTFKVPQSPISKAKARKRKIKVLDEDDYVQQAEEIIERDFFPELDKLKAQNEYIEARERKDYVTMSRLQEKYSGCRPNTGRLQSPSTFETPQDLPRESDPRRPAEDTNDLDTEGGEEVPDISDTPIEKEKMTLDKFLANHTSEDNESFIEIQEENEKKHRIKNAWMYKDEKLCLEMKAQQMSLPSIEQQAELPIKQLDVDTWTYQNINSVFHNPEALELTEEEKIEMAKKQKVIKHDNTRLSKLPWKTEKQMEQLKKEADKQEALAAGKVGIDGKEIVRPETPSVNGFKLMSMAPSPALGVEDSPLMTWGQVEGTPFRLEGCETPLLQGGGGPGFTMKEVSQRDRLAKELADNNSKYYRDRKSKAIAQVKSSIKAGKGLSGMSPAAQRLASGKLGIRVGTDPMLRASYTPSPARKGTGTPTPRHNGKSTPSLTPTRKSGSSKVTPNIGVRTKTPGTGGRPADITDNLLDIRPAKLADKGKVNTDNLLNLNSSRTRAADFFIKPKD